LENQKERGEEMIAKFIIIVLVAFLGALQVSCAENAERVEMEEMIEKVVRDAVESPVEYEIPEDVLSVMQGFQNSYQGWNVHIENHQKVIALFNEKIKTCQAHQAHDASALKHTLRTYLSSKGVPFSDLGNWKPEGNKAVRIRQKE